MAEEIDDNGFYREDFSAVSDWEIFNAQLCELFQKWDLDNSDWGRTFQPNELYQCKWIVEKELLGYQKQTIVVEYYRAELKSLDKHNAGETREISRSVTPMLDDLLSLDNTFGPPVLDNENKLHYLARFYGLRRFVVLTPRNNPFSFITTQSDFSFYFSAISVVAAEVCAAVPMFLQIYHQEWNFFLGLGRTSFMRTNFNLVALQRPPQDYCYLSGLLTMFKEKLPKYCKQPALVSVRNTYDFYTVKMRVPMYVPFDMTPLVDEERSIISLSYFTGLPHGFFPDSYMEMFAIFTWPKLTDNMVIDSARQTQFLPKNAPNVAIHQVVHAASYLTSCVKSFHDLVTAKSLLESYVGRNFANPLGKLTKPYLGKVLTTISEKLPGPINDHELIQMTYYLFPDVYKDVALFPYEPSIWAKELHRIKSAVADSLVHRLSCLLATCNDRFSGKSGLAQLWATFTRQLRLLWESGITIPGVANGFPDTNTCLLHQKLQMLNVCIERRVQREQNMKAKFDSLVGGIDIEEADESNDNEEDFYDCYEDESNRSSSSVKGEEDTKPEGSLKRFDGLKLLDSEEYLYVPITQEQVPKTEDQLQDDADEILKLGSSSEADESNGDEKKIYDCYEDESNRSSSPVKGEADTKPEGRLKRFRGLKLLDSDEYLYVPITQEQVPKTEDQLQDDADVILKLGSSSEHVTAMMCSTLLSDAEAFKAANLNACFEDFIRWYSPNDWEEYIDDDGIKRHKLSIRMSAEGNTWQKVWEQAEAVPVTRQKRLFDDTIEGYKVINYLETRNLGEIYGLTVVPLLHSVILKLKNIFENAHVLELFSESLDEVLADLSRFSREIEIVASSSSSSHESKTNYILKLPDTLDITNKIEQLEIQFYQYKCFETMPELAGINIRQIQKKFEEILKNQGSCTISPRQLMKGEIASDSNKVDERLMASFRGNMQMKLISKDYVIRLGEALTEMGKSDHSDEKMQPVMPQFLRAIVTDKDLRLCGAFTENTAFLD